MEDSTAPQPSPFQQQPETGNPFAKQANINRRKRLIIFGGGAVLVIGIVSLFTWLGTLGGILILEPSNDFTVSLNGSKAQLETRKDGIFIRTSPGLYRLELTKAGFAPFDTNVDISRGQTVQIRPIYSVLPKEAQVAGGSVAFVRKSKDQKHIFYLGNNRQTIYQVMIATQQQVPITLQPLASVKDIQWSNAPDLALVVQGDGTYLQEIPVYDFTNQIKTKIAGAEIGSPVWDPNDQNRIAFTYAPGNGEHSLVFSDIHISALDRKADIASLPDPRLVWAPNSNYILLIPQGGVADQHDLWKYSTVDGSMKRLSTGGSVANASVSPYNGTIIYEQGGNLKTVRPDGSGGHDLQLAGHVAQVAWHDEGSFYLPDNSANVLNLLGLDGKGQKIPFSFPNAAIQGMNYFPDNHTLVFYTDNSIFLADLSK